MDYEGQKFCLKWSQHAANFFKVFNELYKNECFTDVTLVVADAIPIKCHKIILASCSPYFQDIFKHAPEGQHIVVVLNQQKYSHIKAILEYIYQGEVQISAEDLESLTKVAETLKIKGLIREDLHQQHISPNNTCSTAPSSSDGGSPPIPTSEPRTHQHPHVNPYEENSAFHSPNSWGASGDAPSDQNQTAMAAMLRAHAATHPDFPSSSRTHNYPSNTTNIRDEDTPILRTVLGQTQTILPRGNLPYDRILRSVPSTCTVMPPPSASPHQDHSQSPPLNEPGPSHHHHLSPPTNHHKLSPHSRSPEPPPSSGPRTWKRYKNYKPDEINKAIEAVLKKGISALQASRIFKVPSRTLYDKVRKLNEAGHGMSRRRGISRPRVRGRSSDVPTSEDEASEHAAFVGMMQERNLDPNLATSSTSVDPVASVLMLRSYFEQLGTKMVDQHVEGGTGSELQEEVEDLSVRRRPSGEEISSGVIVSPTHSQQSFGNNDDGDNREFQEPVCWKSEIVEDSSEDVAVNEESASPFDLSVQKTEDDEPNTE